MRVYAIAYGPYYSSEYTMDSVYRTTLQSTKDHLHKMGYKFIKASGLWENDGVKMWAKIESFKEVSNAE